MATSAASSEEKGKYGKEGYNALEKHAAFFDRNGDGIIYPWETYQGFRAIGAGRLQSAFAGLIVNMGLSQKTRPGKRFSLLFVESKFEEIFTKHARSHPNALTYKEVLQLLKSDRDPKDFGGWISAYAEWKILYDLCKDKDGLLTRDTVKGAYDGSIFRTLEKERSSSSSSR